MRILIAVGTTEEMERVYQSLISKIRNSWLQRVETLRDRKRIELRGNIEFRILTFDNEAYRSHTCGLSTDYVYYDEVVNRNDDYVLTLSATTYHTRDSVPVIRIRYMPTIDVGEVTRGILWI